MRTTEDHLRVCRIDRGLLQREAAALLNVKLSTYQSWEQGREPGVRFWPSITAWLGYYPAPKPVTLAERLLAYRRLHGMTQEELAERLGVNAGTVRRWEQGGEVRKKWIRSSLATLIGGSV